MLSSFRSSDSLSEGASREKMAYFKFVFLALALALASVTAEHEFMGPLRETLKTCKGGVEVTDHEMEEFMKPLIPETRDEKCLMACVFKAYNVINDNHFDPKIAMAVVKEVLKEVPERVEQIKSILDHCGEDIPKKMDDECELASEIMQCEVKYKKAMGIA